MNSTNCPVEKSETSNDGHSILALRGAPASASAVLEKLGERAFDQPGAKASVQYTTHAGRWVAEFRFRLRSGLYQACTLPLTTSSERFPSQAEAIANAAVRMLASLDSAIDGAKLTAVQSKTVEALKEWGNSLISQAAAKQHGPLAGMRFVDAFAGIGGFHAALASEGAECAGAIELDPDARKTYAANYPGDYPVHDDIRTARADQFGKVDLIVGGFPCQSVSVAGDGAGLNDKSKSGLFFDFAKLIGEMAPSLAILENVAGLASHDNGKTFDAVMNTLADLGYSVSTRLLDSSDFGVPQKRERLFLVCVHDSVLANRIAPFTFPKGADATKVVSDILEPLSKGRRCHRPLARLKKDPLAKSRRIETVGLIDGMNNQGYRVASPLGKGFTLCASSGGVGGKTGLYLVKGKPRALSPRECARMQGFPESFAPHSNPAVALRQFGNSVAVPVVSALARQLGKIRA